MKVAKPQTVERRKLSTLPHGTVFGFENQSGIYMKTKPCEGYSHVSNTIVALQEPYNVAEWKTDFQVLVFWDANLSLERR